MSNLDKTYTQYRVQEKQTDELMIANMINALANPNISSLFSKDEYMLLCQVVKNHVVNKAQGIIEKQEQYTNQNNGMSR